MRNSLAVFLQFDYHLSQLILQTDNREFSILTGSFNCVEDVALDFSFRYRH
jgi:hypothetical protein